MISGVKEIGLPLEDKLEFLRSILVPVMYTGKGIDDENWRNFIARPILESFLSLIPEWHEEFANCGIEILRLLAQKELPLIAEGLQGKIKKFVHSYLNKVKKERMNESLVMRILIRNGMFEEMISYSFISHEATGELWDFLFVEDVNHREDCYFHLFKDDHFTVRRERGKVEAEKRIAICLSSWDTVVDRHALATLWTLLTKRGDLKEIFGLEEPKEEPKKEG